MLLFWYTLSPSSYSSTTHHALVYAYFVLIIILLLPALVAGDCPPNPQSLVYSPFKPVSQAEYRRYTGATNNGCWWWAICLYSNADAARQQQFSATALVMGLIPLTLRSVEWPKGRMVFVAKSLSLFSETLVRALGVVPVEDNGMMEKKESVYTWAQARTRNEILLVLVSCASGFSLLLASLGVIEWYSKRSSIGCPYPFFIMTWHLVALMPAFLHTLIRRRQRSKLTAEYAQSVHEDGRNTGNDLPDSGSAQLSSGPMHRFVTGRRSTAVTGSGSREKSQTADDAFSTAVQASTSEPDMQRLPFTSSPSPVGSGIQREKHFASIQDEEQHWVVQFIWAIYYIVGTLVYTSIMAVTAIELTVWVLASCFTLALSKETAFFACMAFGGLPTSGAPKQGRDHDVDGLEGSLVTEVR